MLVVRRLVLGQLRSNCYILSEKNQAIIVDPADDAEFIAQKLAEADLTPTQIIATHGHFDHILATNDLQLIYQIPFLIHKRDEFLLTRMQSSARRFLGVDLDVLPPQVSGNLTENRLIKVGASRLQIIETPGHTPGSVCLYAKEANLMLTGDTIFADGGVGRTDFSYSSTADLQFSLTKIFSFPPETKLYPGHGQDSSIKYEQLIHRPFV